MLLLSTVSNGISIEPRLVLIVLVAAAAVLIGNFIMKAIKKDKLTKASAALSRGDKIVLCNGMNGTFLSKSEGTVEVELSSGARARFMEWAVLEANGKKL